MVTTSQKVTKPATDCCSSAPAPALIRREVTAASAAVANDGSQKWTVIPSVDDNNQKKATSAIAALASNTEQPLSSNASKGNICASSFLFVSFNKFCNLQIKIYKLY